MKKGYLKKLIVCTVAAVSMLSTAAFASANTKTAANQGQKAQQQFYEEYFTVEGDVDSVTKKDGDYYFNLKTSFGSSSFKAEKGTPVFNQKNLTFNSGLSTIKKGDAITLAMRLTGYQPVEFKTDFIVLNEDGAFMDLSVYDSNLVNSSNTLKLIIGKDTVITDRDGNKKVYTKDDIRGSQCLVFYDKTTRSIPAQTTPQMVMILNENAGEFCIHGFEADVCPVCNGSAGSYTCRHGADRRYCNICNDDICIHGIDEDYCRICNDDICIHGVDEDHCRICNDDICIHGVDEDYCRICNDDICMHGLDEDDCSICDRDDDECRHGEDWDDCKLCGGSWNNGHGHHGGHHEWDD